MKTHKPNFELVVLNPPAVYGPLRHSIDKIDDLNTSNELLYKAFLTSQKSAPVPPDALHISVDVRVSERLHLHRCRQSCLFQSRTSPSPITKRPSPQVSATVDIWSLEEAIPTRKFAIF